MGDVFALVLFTILAVLVIAIIIVAMLEKEPIFAILFTIFLIGFVITIIGCITNINQTYNTIPAIEVYRGNTSLKITYIDSIPQDTIVVYKHKVLHNL